jgi:hypothetical protein
MTLRSRDQRIEKVKPSLAEKMFPLQAKPTAPRVEGWAKERKEWGEHDQRARGFMSPLGGKAKDKTS